MQPDYPAMANALIVKENAELQLVENPLGGANFLFFGRRQKEQVSVSTPTFPFGWHRPVTKWEGVIRVCPKFYANNKKAPPPKR